MAWKRSGVRFPLAPRKTAGQGLQGLGWDSFGAGERSQLATLATSGQTSVVTVRSGSIITLRADRCRANGTASTVTRRHGRHARRRSGQRTSTRQTPKSNARHVAGRGCQLCRARLVHPHQGHSSRRRRSRTSTTTTWSVLLNSTAVTHTPARSSSRLNTVVARTACDLWISVPWTARDRGAGRAHPAPALLYTPNRPLTSTDACSTLVSDRLLLQESPKWEMCVEGVFDA
jgi:hypothetical protein